MRRLVASLAVVVAMLAGGITAAHAEPSAPDPLDVSDAEAPASSYTTTDPSEPQCSGPKFAATSTDAKAAAYLMRRYVTIPTFKLWRMPSDLVKLTWREDPYKNNNWVFNLHTLRWVDVLRREGKRQGNAAMLARYEAIVHDWVSNNPSNKPRSVYAWNDMAVGVRAIGLVCATTVIDENLPRNAWLKTALATHARALMDPRQYRRTGNHGLHQNMGLLALACHTGNPQWKSTATGRSTTLLKRSVDTQGVTDEGSMLYQSLNFGWYNELRTRLVNCGITPHPYFGNVGKMTDILAQATQPDGTLVAFGDTSAKQRSPVFSGTGTQYAVTKGKVGPKPTRMFSIFKRGYAFSRSGWFDTQPGGKQSLAALRFGTGLRFNVHGHQDSANVSYFALGKQILWQPGVYGGGGGSPRRYVVSNEAHNVIDIPAARYNIRAKTALSVTRTTKAYDLVSVKSKALTGAVWKRTMIHFKGPELLLVDDRVTQKKAHTVIQRWHFGADRKVKPHKGYALTSGPGSDSTVLWIGAKPKVKVVRGRKKPTLGWRSEKVNHFIKSPTVEASRKAKSVRMTAIIVPRRGGASSRSVKLISSSTRGSSRSAVIKIGSIKYRITFTSARASVARIR